MITCPQCGMQFPDGVNFCGRCGTRLMPQQQAPVYAQPVYAAPAPAAQPVYAAPAAQPVMQQQEPVRQMPVQPAASGNYSQFSGIPIRYRCANGHNFDGIEGQSACPTCGAGLEKGGFIQIYRMGSFSGCAVGMEIYVDGVMHGLIGNKQSLRVSVPYGSHLLHIAHTMTRKCNDPVITVTPEMPYVFCKVHFSRGGFAIVIDPASPDDMPLA